MLHVVARTVRHHLLFHRMVDGTDLFHRLDRLPLVALCGMPDHVHLMASTDVRRRMAAVLSGWARRRNVRKGLRGALVEPPPEAQVLVDRQKQQRTVRYLHLVPRRAGLVDDPLAWPLSTHRDACGLTVRRVGPARRAEWFYRYVSGDPSVDAQGTELPREGGLPAGGALGGVGGDPHAGGAPEGAEDAGAGGAGTGGAGRCVAGGGAWVSPGDSVPAGGDVERGTGAGAAGGR